MGMDTEVNTVESPLCEADGYQSTLKSSVLQNVVLECREPQSQQLHIASPEDVLPFPL